MVLRYRNWAHYWLISDAACHTVTRHYMNFSILLSMDYEIGSYLGYFLLNTCLYFASTTNYYQNLRSLRIIKLHFNEDTFWLQCIRQLLPFTFDQLNKFNLIIFIRNTSCEKKVSKKHFLSNDSLYTTFTFGYLQRIEN